MLKVPFVVLSMLRRSGVQFWRNSLNIALIFALAALPAAAQVGKISGTVADPDEKLVIGATITASDQGAHATVSTSTGSDGAYEFDDLTLGVYLITVNAPGFKPALTTVSITSEQTVCIQNFTLALAVDVETVQVSSGTFENAYRVDQLKQGGPLGTEPILNQPYTVNVISRQLIDDTQSRNFKEAAKYLPLVSFQEMQGPEVLRPETRGMQGTNMQGDRRDGMGFAVTTPSAMEEYEQIEILSGAGGSMYGPSNPSGIFNFVSKRPTEEMLLEPEIEYEGRSVVTGHLDFGGRVGPKKIFGYRSNLVLGDGTGYVTDSQLRRQLASIALDIRPFEHTSIGGNFSYYNLYQHGYPGWFSYNPTLNPSTPPTGNTSYNAKYYSRLPVDAPDPERQGYGQRFLGSDMNNQIGEVRIQQQLKPNWHLTASVLQQTADRNINTPVNAFYDSKGDYQTFEENEFQGTLAARFQVKSDLGYVTGRFKTGRFTHDVVFGSTGYKFSTWNPKTAPTTKALCQLGSPKVCSFNIASPQIDANPGVTSFTGAYALYVTSIIHQQGFNFGDTITLTPHLQLRAAASQDWTWTNSYKPPGGPANETPGYTSQSASPSGSVLYKPTSNQTAYFTFSDSIQAPDMAPSSSGSTIVANSNQPLPPYRSTQFEIGYKVQAQRMNFSADIFRLRRPYADVAELSTTSGYNCGGTILTKGQICERDQIIGQQVNYGAEAMFSGRITQSMQLIGGITALRPRLTDTFVLLPAGNPYVSPSCKDPAGVAASALVCPSYVTNNKNLVGIPDYKSNLLAEYRVPKLATAFFTFDWQHVSRRAADDMNRYWVPEYNLFDVGGRYNARIFGKVATWLVTVNNVSNVHYWSTLGPGSITGQSAADLAHLGEPRLVTASMRYAF